MSLGGHTIKRTLNFPKFDQSRRCPLNLFSQHNYIADAKTHELFGENRNFFELLIGNANAVILINFTILIITKQCINTLFIKFDKHKESAVQIYLIIRI